FLIHVPQRGTAAYDLPITRAAEVVSLSPLMRRAMIAQPELFSPPSRAKGDGPAPTPVPRETTSPAQTRTLALVSLPALPAPDAPLVADPRASLTPAQMVEQKLIALLKADALPISHVQILCTGMNRGGALGAPSAR